MLEDLALGLISLDKAQGIFQDLTIGETEVVKTLLLEAAALTTISLEEIDGLEADDEDEEELGDILYRLVNALEEDEDEEPQQLNTKPYNLLSWSDFW
jgi:hypothetical protein